ncbi:MAG: hypothetical protein ACI9W2_000566 [Gammaproteobacteria bacterium]|jgi:hypothetical protein
MTGSAFARAQLGADCWELAMGIWLWESGYGTSARGMRKRTCIGTSEHHPCTVAGADQMQPENRVEGRTPE